MTKQEQINAKLNKPIEVDDIVTVSITYDDKQEIITGKGKNKKVNVIFESKELKFTAKIIKIIDNTDINCINKLKYCITRTGSVSIPYKLYDVLNKTYTNDGYEFVVDADMITPTFNECGAYPFLPKKVHVNFFSNTIDLLLNKVGLDRKNSFEEVKTTYGVYGVNFNPYVINDAGKKEYYQRAYCWTLEQNQLLIDSIYNGIEIGKFLFKMNDWSKICTEEEQGFKPYNYDCIDGKQRLNAIIGFVQNKYPDSFGNYWDDLSTKAQRTFLDYGNLTVGEMNEHASDAEVIETFLTLNFCGVPMSKEHIDYVKTINIKK